MELQLFGRLHRDLFKVPRLPSAGLNPANQIGVGLTLVLHDEQGSLFKNQFQIFEPPIFGEARET